MTDIQEIVARLEAASGPDREMDLAIAVACNQWHVYHHNRPALEDCTGRKVLRYTGSLNAALTLVPEGWTVANVGQRDDRSWWAELRKGYQTSYDAVSLSGIPQAQRFTAPLALCIAALRARSAIGSR